MGFGWLFFGYLFLLTPSGLDFLPDTVGFLFMIKGLSLLGEFGVGFLRAKRISYAAVLLSASLLAFDLTGYICDIKGRLSPIPDTVTFVNSLVYYVVLILFTVVLLLAVRDISLEAGTPKITEKAKRNLLIVPSLYATDFIIIILCNFPVFSSEIAFRVRAVGTLAVIIAVILDAVMIYSCYRRICIEGEDDMDKPVKHILPSPYEYYRKRKEYKDSLRHDKKDKR